VIRAGKDELKNSRPNSSQMQCQQAVQPMDILFQSDLKVKFITQKVYKMKQQFKFLFFLKKGKGLKSGILPIYARITIDGKRIEWSIQRSCLPSRWKRQIGRAIGTKSESSELNDYLDVIQNSIYDIQKEFALKKELLTAGIMKTRILNKSEERNHTILDVYSYHNEQFKKMVGVQLGCASVSLISPTLMAFFNSCITSRSSIP
jgi:Arm DNA-binding domain